MEEYQVWDLPVVDSSNILVDFSSPPAVKALLN